MRRPLPVAPALVVVALLALLAGALPPGWVPVAAQDGAATPGATPIAAADCPAGTEEENTALARRWFEDILNRRNLDALDGLLAPDVAYAGVTFPDSAADYAAARRILDALLTGFPDIRYTVDAQVADGDLVALRWTATGTNRGEFLGDAPTNRAATWTGINLFQLACGRIAAVWPESDVLGRSQQLGLAPETGTWAVTVGIEIGVGATADGPGTPAAATPLAEECAETGRTENEVLARRWWGEAWNRGNVDALAELLADDLVHHWATGPDTTGADEVATRVLAWRGLFPDLRVRTEEVAAAGDLVAARWTATGTMQGSMRPAANGQPVAWTGINFFRVECGRIAEIWSEMDTLGLYRQLGIEPAVPATPAP